ncbi:glycosyltransferase [Actinocorallia longicatena]|uniref:Glycosyltransferase n=1 Tax=Actinocorallia longicatena TaxID=111803 RepID=A0ABP6QUK4_9ACTN
MGRTVVIFAAGSRGDLQPCLALGRGLTDRGDQVRIIASRRYERLIADTGLDFFPLSMDPTEIVDSPEGQELLAGGRNPVRFLRNLNRIVRPIADRMLKEVQAGSDGADLILAPTLAFLGSHLGEHFGIPHAIIHFQPSQPTGAFPHPFLKQARYLGPIGNRASYELLEHATWQLARPFVNSWRRDALRLPAEPFLGGPLAKARKAKVLCAFSSTVVRRPADWPENIHLTGYWFLDQPTWTPPPELEKFLLSGPPPVYVGFGSMAPGDPEATDAAIRDALRATGNRGVLLGDPGTSDDDVLVLREAPHSWLFPRMAAVVHHGGAGTTAEGLRAGVPSLVCPFFGDQPYWADRIHALGAGPAPLPISKLTPESLAASLRATTTRAHRDRATDLSRALAAEDGVARACETLDVLQP